jgi:ubiquinone/menaquinone biosynthesis C-methylase UbiE
MSTYAYMKLLESSPERYDRGIERLSRGVISTVYRRIAERAAGPDRRILDIGCGTGGVALACAELGSDVIGIDTDAGMLEVARRKSSLRAPRGSVTWIELGAMELEDRFDPESFDAVVACLVFSELTPEERAYALCSGRSLLRPGGLAVIADEVPVTGARTVRAWRSLRRLPRVILAWALTQTTTRPVEGLAEALREAGFRDVAQERVASDLAIVQGRKAAA